MLFKKQIIIALLFLVLGFTIKAEVILNKDKDIYAVTQDLEILIDTTDKMTFSDIRHAYQDKFSLESIPYLEKENNYTYWGRLNITNNTALTSNKSWYFESFGFDIDEIEFYIPTQGGYIKQEMGYFKPFSYRNIYHKNFVFFLDLRPGESKTYYIKLRRRYPMRLNFIVRTNEFFIQHTVIEYWSLGIFYGILGFIILVNIYLFFSLKDKTYLFYLFVVFSEVLYCLGRDGLGFQFIWPDKPWVNLFTHHNVTQFLFVVSSIVYAIHFLKLRADFQKMYHLALWLVGIRAILFIIWFFNPITPFPVFLLDALILTIPFVSGVLSLVRGKVYTRFYVVAFSCLYLSFLLIILDERQLLPASFKIGWYLINMGMFLEVLFLAIAMIDQIRVFKRDKENSQIELIKQLQKNEKLKDKVNAELETKVEERTKNIKEIIYVLEKKNRDLGLNNTELKELNDKISSMNALLEMDNKDLQTDVHELNKSRILLKEVTLDDFKQVFPDESACLNFLADLKWKEGFKCKKCGYGKSSEGKAMYSKRCKNCNYDESPTSYTLFHRIRFPLTKAFYLVYLTQAKSQQNLTMDELSEIVELRRETCWSFKQKIIKAEESLSKAEKTFAQNDIAGWGKLILIYTDT